MLRIYSGKGHFHQWDINQKIIVDDDAIKEIHFDNGTSDALVCAVYEYDGLRVADVPNILLTDYWMIKVYAFCGECVRYEQCYNVMKRNKPADYVYTETEIKRYEDLEKRISLLEQSSGGTGIDLSNYYTKEETNETLKGYVLQSDFETALGEYINDIDSIVGGGL